MPDLVLYTESYPFNRSETFLETEIQYLSDIFDSVYIQPLNGNGQKREVPINVRVMDPLGALSCSKIKMYAYGFINMRIIFSEQSIERNLGHVSLLKAVKYIGLGFWIRKKLKKNMIECEAIHYSYWLNYSAFALALISKGGNDSFFVSRGHRYDLYTGQGEPALDFLKLFTIKYLHKLFLVSENGLNFIRALYPEYSQKYQLSRLGISDQKIENPLNNQSKFYLVSCSSLKPVKRVGLILDALICLGIIHPDFEITWIHIGEGELVDLLMKKVTEKLRNTLIKCCFKGSLSNSEVIEFYHKQPIDVFINVSETEGIPVSIMEAQSFSIPVLATSTGGTPEIVNNLNGLLIDVNIKPDELSKVISKIYLDRENWKNKRILSRENWKLNFNAEKNYRTFALELKDLYLNSDKTNNLQKRG